MDTKACPTWLKKNDNYEKNFRPELTSSRKKPLGMQVDRRDGALK